MTIIDIIKSVDEAENERMHLMSYIEITQPKLNDYLPDMQCLLTQFAHVFFQFRIT